MIYYFLLLNLIDSTIYKDITNYSIGLRFYLNNGTDISTLNQNQIFMKGIEIQDNLKMPSSNTLYIKYEKSDIPQKHILFYETYSRLTHADKYYITKISDKGINTSSDNKLNEVSGNLMIKRIMDCFLARKDIKSVITKRFGNFEAACKIPIINTKRYKFDRISFNFSFDRVNLDVVDINKDNYTLEEILKIYDDFNNRINVLSILYTIKFFQIPSGYLYSSIS